MSRLEQNENKLAVLKRDHAIRVKQYNMALRALERTEAAIKATEERIAEINKESVNG